MNGTHTNDNLEQLQLSYQKLVNQLIKRQFEKVWQGNLELIANFPIEIVKEIVHENSPDDHLQYKDLWNKSWCLLITALSKIYEEEFSKVSSDHFDPGCLNQIAQPFQFDNFHTIILKINKSLKGIIFILNVIYYQNVFLIPDDIILTCIVVSIQHGQFNFAEAIAKYYLSSFHALVLQQSSPDQQASKIDLDPSLQASYEAIASSLVLFVLCPLEKYLDAETMVQNDLILTDTSKQIIRKNLIEQSKQIQLRKKQDINQSKASPSLLSPLGVNGSISKSHSSKPHIYQGKELPPNYKPPNGRSYPNSNSYLVQLRQFSDGIYHRIQLMSPVYRTTISVFLFTIVFVWWSRRRLITPWVQKYANPQGRGNNSFLMRVWRSLRPALPPTSGPQSVI